MHADNAQVALIYELVRIRSLFENLPRELEGREPAMAAFANGDPVPLRDAVCQAAAFLTLLLGSLPAVSPPAQDYLENQEAIQPDQVSAVAMGRAFEQCPREDVRAALLSLLSDDPRAWLEMIENTEQLMALLLRLVTYL